MEQSLNKATARVIAADFISLCFLILWIGLATGVVLAAGVLLLARGAAAAEVDARHEAVQAHELATRYASLAGMDRAPVRPYLDARQPSAIEAPPDGASVDDEALGKIRRAAGDSRVRSLAGAAMLIAGLLILRLRRRRVSRARISLWTYPTYPDPDVPIGMECALPEIRRERMPKGRGID